MREALQEAAKANGGAFVKTHAPDLKRVKGVPVDKLNDHFTREDGGSGPSGNSGDDRGDRGDQADDRNDANESDSQQMCTHRHGLRRVRAQAASCIVIVKTNQAARSNTGVVTP